MKLIEADIELIDKYMYNKLSEEDMSLFQKRLVNNPSFNEQYEFVLLIKNNLKLNSFNEKLTMLQDLEKDLSQSDLGSDKPNKIKKRSKNKILYLFSSVAAIITLLVFMLPGVINPDSNKIIDEHFTAISSHVLKRTTTQNLSKIKLNAYKYYSIEEYERAIPLFLQLKENGDHNVDAHLVSAYIKDHQYQKAQRIVEVRTEQSNINNKDAEWFQAFIFLGQNNTKKAISSLNKISNSTSPYKTKAEKLMKYLSAE